MVRLHLYHLRVAPQHPGPIIMRIRTAIITAIAAAALACSDSGVTNPPPPPPTGVFLKDVVIPNLPSPYYHFEYDAAGRVLGASFASGVRNYNLTYDGG